MANDREPFRPDYLSFHKTLQHELDAVKDRVRHLIRHWATDGAFKETALRTVLRRYLPESLFIGTGFVVTRERCSTQVDVLIVNRQDPTLFKDGDLLIVTPEVVRGIIEVKTGLEGPQAIDEACDKLCMVKALCATARNMRRSELWAGLFVYGGEANQDRHLLAGVRKAYDAMRCTIDGIGYGRDTVLHYSAEQQLGRDKSEKNCWSTWHVPGMASSYFVGLMLNYWFNVAIHSDPIAWLPGQVENRATYYITAQGDDGVLECPHD